jgi:hypothetical protein
VCYNTLKLKGDKIMERQPDLTVHKGPIGIWVLREGETIPEGYGHTTTDDGVTLVFRPMKEEEEGYDELPIH